ncbi:hypothetical protein [Lysobacter enzymogenes]|uniref:hypothetical protein n=1 Tax=Lysobacter enzymogenes TaxID=69 RepID=UPI001A968A0F|nr:hypothetical protein [Lysobacter enzymogenes]QQP98018.1 hypothetical protein JHW38_08450 [Lysobacter enzymogenes]
MSAIHPFHHVVAETARQPRPTPPAGVPAYARAAAAPPRTAARERSVAACGRVAAGRSAERAELR